MINEQKLDAVLLELGHDDFNRGTAFLREAVFRWDQQPKQAMTKELYPAIAKNHGSTASRVERCIRHSIGKAWGRGSQEAQERYFGFSVDPDKGTPTNGEYISRLARVCAHE